MVVVDSAPAAGLGASETASPRARPEKRLTLCDPAAPPPKQGFVRSTTKYWVRAEDVSNVKYHVLQHLPVFQHDKEKFGGE